VQNEVTADNVTQRLPKQSRAHIQQRPTRSTVWLVEISTWDRIADTDTLAYITQLDT